MSRIVLFALLLDAVLVTVPGRLLMELDSGRSLEPPRVRGRGRRGPSILLPSE